MKTKTCPTCGRELPADRFYENSRNGQPTGKCKECRSQYRREYRQSRPEVIARGRAEDKARRERIKAETAALTAKTTPPHISLEEAARIYRNIVGKEIHPDTIRDRAYTFRQWGVFKLSRSGDPKLVGIRKGDFRRFVRWRHLLGVEIFHTNDDGFSPAR